MLIIANDLHIKYEIIIYNNFTANNFLKVLIESSLRLLIEANNPMGVAINRLKTTCLDTIKFLDNKNNLLYL